MFKENLLWGIHMESKVNVWEDKWVGDCFLRTLLLAR